MRDETGVENTQQRRTALHCTLITRQFCRCIISLQSCVRKTLENVAVLMFVHLWLVLD